MCREYKPHTIEERTVGVWKSVCIPKTKRENKEEEETIFLRFDKFINIPWHKKGEKILINIFISVCMCFYMCILFLYFSIYIWIVCSRLLNRIYIECIDTRATAQTIYWTLEYIVPYFICRAAEKMHAPH